MFSFSKLKRTIKNSELKEKLLTGESVQKKYATLLLISSAIIIIWIIVFKCNINEALHIQENLEKTLWERFTYRLVPFTDVIYLIRTGTFGFEGLAFLFNIICFIPLGILVRFFATNKRGVLFLFLFSMGVEIFQLFTGFGGFDLTDTLLNTVGAFLGCMLFTKLRKLVSERTVNIVLLALTVPICSWAIFAIVRTVIYFPI